MDMQPIPHMAEFQENLKAWGEVRVFELDASRSINVKTLALRLLRGCELKMCRMSSVRSVYMSEKNKRRYSRVPYFGSCLVEREGKKPQQFKMTDLGAGGFAIEAKEPFAAGEIVQAVFGDSIAERGRVAYCEATASDTYHVGVSFLKSEQADENNS